MKKLTFLKNIATLFVLIFFIYEGGGNLVMAQAESTDFYLDVIKRNNGLIEVEITSIVGEYLTIDDAANYNFYLTFEYLDENGIEIYKKGITDMEDKIVIRNDGDETGANSFWYPTNFIYNYIIYVPDCNPTFNISDIKKIRINSQLIATTGNALGYPFFYHINYYDNDILLENFDSGDNCHELNELCKHSYEMDIAISEVLEPQINLYEGIINCNTNSRIVYTTAYGGCPPYQYSYQVNGQNVENFYPNSDWGGGDFYPIPNAFLAPPLSDFQISIHDSNNPQNIKTEVSSTASFLPLIDNITYTLDDCEFHFVVDHNNYMSSDIKFFIFKDFYNSENSNGGLLTSAENVSSFENKNFSESGTYVVVFYDYDWKCNQVFTIDVQDPSLLNINIPKLIPLHCYPASITLNAPTADSYEWVNLLEPDVPLSVSQEVSLNFSETGFNFFRLKLIYNNNSCEILHNFQVYVKDDVLVDIKTKPGLVSYICNDNANYLSVDNGYANIQWFIDGVEIQGNNSTELEVTKGGIYTVSITDYSGCIAQGSEEIFDGSFSAFDLGDDICDASSAVELNYSFDYDFDQTYYTWSTGEAGNKITVQENGSYELSVRNISNDPYTDCTQTDDIYVLFDEPVDFIIPPVMCQNMGDIDLLPNQSILDYFPSIMFEVVNSSGDIAYFYNTDIFFPYVFPPGDYTINAIRNKLGDCEAKIMNSATFTILDEVCCDYYIPCCINQFRVFPDNHLIQVDEPEIWTMYENPISGQPNNELFVLEDLIIDSNSEIEMLDMTITFGDKGRLIVMPGAKLTIKNCTLKGTACGNMWQGIRVLGPGSDENITTVNAGQLIIQNTVIEDALIALANVQMNVEGVELSSSIFNSFVTENVPPLDFTNNPSFNKFNFMNSQMAIQTAGGIIHAKETTFNNCFYGAYLAYNNGTGNAASYFKTCTFQQKGEGLKYPFDNWEKPEVGIHIANTLGLINAWNGESLSDADVFDCSFNNLKFGVNTYSSNRLSFDYSRFENCEIGISIRNYNNNSDFSKRNVVNFCAFDFCLTAIQCDNTAIHLKDNNINTRYIELNYDWNINTPLSTGIIVEAGPFNIERNDIKNVTVGLLLKNNNLDVASVSNTWLVDTRELSTDVDNSIVYKNRIKNMLVGLNIKDDNTAVQIKCNEFRKYQLMGWALNGPPETAVLSSQGFCDEDSEIKNSDYPGNQFIEPLEGYLWDIYAHYEIPNMEYYIANVDLFPPQLNYVTNNIDLKDCSIDPSFGFCGANIPNPVFGAASGETESELHTATTYSQNLADILGISESDIDRNDQRNAKKSQIAGEENYTRTAFKVYPNPAQNTLFISKSEEVKVLKILNTQGLLLKHFGTVNNHPIDISDLASGLYFYEIITHDNSEYKGKFNILK